jgi:hypothetical protein
MVLFSPFLPSIFAFEIDILLQRSKIDLIQGRLSSPEQSNLNEQWICATLNFFDSRLSLIFLFGRIFPKLKRIRCCYLVFLIIIIISKLGKTVQQTQLRAEKQRNKLL